MPATTASDKGRCDIVVTNGFVVTVDRERRVLEHGAVAIDGRRIAAVGPADEIAKAWKARSVIDAHNHIVHTTCRGILDRYNASNKVSFADWKADVTSEDEHVSTQFSCLELLRHGFTLFIEPGTAFDNDAVAEAVESVGMRALLAGCYIWDQVDIMKHL